MAAPKRHVSRKSAATPVRKTAAKRTGSAAPVRPVRTTKPPEANLPVPPQAPVKTAAAKARAPTAATAVAVPLPVKPERPKKAKLVRDSFTIPKNEYLVLQSLKDRAAKLGHPAKKSEVLRAGVSALAAMGDLQLLAALDSVPSIKTGRPAKA